MKFFKFIKNMFVKNKIDSYNPLWDFSCLSYMGSRDGFEIFGWEGIERFVINIGDVNSCHWIDLDIKKLIDLEKYEALSEKEIKYLNKIIKEYK